MAVNNTGDSTIQPVTRKIKSGAIDYSDFVIEAYRKSSHLIEVKVQLSPAGDMESPVTISFSENEVRELRNSFYLSNGKGSNGRALITQLEATELGKRLSRVLFPPAVFQYLSKSLSKVVKNKGGGLRIRLALDESLIDLPWEYVYRPDRLGNEGVSGFLLMDATISMVRQPANKQIVLTPITGKQRLAFVGTLWAGQVDKWEIKKEFQLLKTALKPVSAYITPDFNTASSDLLGATQHYGAAIFHYSGHCDFDNWGSAFLVQEVPVNGKLLEARKTYMTELAETLAQTGNEMQTRLIVLSACNSGFWPVVYPLLKAGVPTVVGINGVVSTQSTIEFCAKLYESLAIGLTLDEAVNHARLHVMEWGQQLNLFDWGLFMVYMQSAESVIFPRKATAATTSIQKQVRDQHSVVIDSAIKLAENLDGLNFGEIMSELSKHRVLILGRFTEKRLKMLEAIKEHLKRHKNHYIPELFTFPKPDEKGLTESIIGFAALSKFIIADLSEPKSVPSELQAIVPNFFSVPVVPIIINTEEEYATFSDIQRRENVIKPTIRYNNLDDLLEKLERVVLPLAEAKLNELQER